MIAFMGVEANASLQITRPEGVPIAVETGYDSQTHRLAVSLRGVPCDETVTLTFASPLMLAANDVLPRCREILNHAQIGYELKAEIDDILTGDAHERNKLSSLLALDAPQAVLQALMEILLA